MACRICLGDSAAGLGSPCRCTGSIAQVHRECLDSWRATGGRRAFVECGVCLFAYRVTYVATRRPGRRCILARLLGKGLVGVAGTQLWLCCLAAALFALDSGRVYLQLLQRLRFDVQPDLGDGFLAGLKAHRTSYYLLALALSLAGVGVAGLASWLGETRAPAQRAAPWMGPRGAEGLEAPAWCDCAVCCVDNGEAFVVCVLVALVAFALLGVFFPIAWVVAATDALVRRKVTRRALADLARAYPVVDLAGQGEDRDSEVPGRAGCGDEVLADMHRELALHF